MSIFVKGIDGKQYKFIARDKKRDNASQLHLKARGIIKEIYPHYPLLEEVRLPGSSFRDLIADFYIPPLKLFIEVQGQQHFDYNSHYFSGQKSFAKLQQRDREKRMWFDINNFEIIYLNYNEDSNEWRKKLKQ